MKDTIKFNNIADAIDDIRKGKLIIVVDDEKRENEGDFICAAEKITPGLVNFMITHGRGLVCVPLTESRCNELELNQMVSENTDPLNTAFTVSVDLKSKDVSTGISADDRSKTILALVNPKTKSKQLSRPGHIFPLIAKEGGVLRRTGHTEAAIDFARLAGLKPAGVLIEIIKNDGSMARLPDLQLLAKKFDLKIVSIEDLVAYRMNHDSLIVKKIDTEINIKYGKYRLRAYQQTTNNQIHLALTIGKWEKSDSILTRINSSRINDDVLGFLTGAIDKSLDRIFKKINENKRGAVLFINHQQSSEDLLSRIKSLEKIQTKGENKSVPPIKMDYKDFGIGAQILYDINIRKLKVLSNSKKIPRIGLTGYGLKIVDHLNY
ncbi:MAG: 3,4-dihydroxy-2-butanone-4-phosphate synthase [Flavobacteriaceae bacterium]|jgi:3,4-dihydroxy 2-butanone 4-phosphate synthase/GTP cyclohydrolase II|nr:3,4-dihydroxy-2-butanone-4-phosphate synthase [Flavobacteriaceae bacterium]|tara:strand:+ start:434 stop:1567 length:1134 start_codon:yes stop_codon:yes gene_type:complete